MRSDQGGVDASCYHPPPRSCRARTDAMHLSGGYRPCRRRQHALGTAASADPRFSPGAGCEDHRGDDHRHHRTDARVRRHVGWLPAFDPDRLRHLDRVRSFELLPDILLIRRRGARVMSAHIEGFEVPLHRSLTEPILLAGAPRAIAIVNGTVAAALGLGLRLWIAGLALWVIGHSLAVFAAKRDPHFVEVLAPHLRQTPWPPILNSR